MAYEKNMPCLGTQLRPERLSFFLTRFIRPYETARVPLEGFSLLFMLQFCTKIYCDMTPESSSSGARVDVYYKAMTQNTGSRGNERETIEELLFYATAR
jgi:hypothetical protein